jgi:hypothetical protein
MWRRFGRETVMGLFNAREPNPNDYSLKPFIRTKSLFVHVPKTGGVSISSALYGCLGMGHLPIREYRKLLRPRAFARMFKFTFVRNPFDRIHSAYRFLRTGGMGELDAEFNQRILDQFRNFEHFVIEGLECEEVVRFWHFVPQIHFLGGDAAAVADLDFIGRYEMLKEDFNSVRRRVNPSAILSHYNPTRPREDYRLAYTAEMIDCVARHYALDLAVFKYQFDGSSALVRPRPDKQTKFADRE